MEHKFESSTMEALARKYIRLLSSFYGIKVWTDSDVDPEVKIREIERIIYDSLEQERGEQNADSHSSKA